MEAGAGIGFASALGVLAFFGGIALIVLVSGKGEVQKRQLEHAERMKALELGRPLPDADIAWAGADRGRAVAAGFIGTLVPLVLIGSALGGTAIVFTYTVDSTWRVVLAAIIWGVCGLVSLVTVVTALGVLARRSAGVKPEKTAAKSSPITESSEAIQEHAATV
jgi:hypothetical protein